MPYRSKAFILWAYLSLFTNGLLICLFAIMLAKQQGFFAESRASASMTQLQLPSSSQSSQELGPRHKLTYDQWVVLLKREAEAIVADSPHRLSILLGDSLSLWFPPNLLPDGRSWLNQGISGETTSGLLKRLDVIDRTKPETIFLMIGINDLLKGIDDATLLQNSNRIIDYLKYEHPKAQLVLQSILPHAAERTTWEGRDRLKFVSNIRIRQLNRQLATLAERKGIYYLDLHSLFTDGEGNLRAELTTDGLHLSTQGYWVWRSALLIFTQTNLEKNRTTVQKSGIGG